MLNILNGNFLFSHFLFLGSIKIIPFKFLNKNGRSFGIYGILYIFLDIYNMEVGVKFIWKCMKGFREFNLILDQTNVAKGKIMRLNLILCSI